VERPTSSRCLLLLILLPILGVTGPQAVLCRLSPQRRAIPLSPCTCGV
jgi:hypothetical protein